MNPNFSDKQEKQRKHQFFFGCFGCFHFIAVYWLCSEHFARANRHLLACFPAVFKSEHLANLQIPLARHVVRLNTTSLFIGSLFDFHRSLGLSPAFFQVRNRDAKTTLGSGHLLVGCEFPREGAGAKSSVCDLEPREKQHFGGMSRNNCRDVPEIQGEPIKFENESLCSVFGTNISGS